MENVSTVEVRCGRCCFEIVKGVHVYFEERDEQGRKTFSASKTNEK